MSELGLFFDALDLDKRERAIAGKVVQEIRDRLGFLDDVGVGYLSLDRAAPTPERTADDAGPGAVVRGHLGQAADALQSSGGQCNGRGKFTLAQVGMLHPDAVERANHPMRSFRVGVHVTDRRFHAGPAGGFEKRPGVARLQFDIRVQQQDCIAVGRGETRVDRGRFGGLLEFQHRDRRKSAAHA